VKESFHGTVLAAAADAIVSLGQAPAKLNPVIKPLMAAIRGEETLELQRRSAYALSQLISLLCDRVPSPNDRVIQNVCAMLSIGLAESFIADNTTEVVTVVLQRIIIITFSEQRRATSVNRCCGETRWCPGH